MAKASSAKKIARVAAASGSKRAKRTRNLGFTAGIAAIVIVGLLLVAFARRDNQAASANDTPPRANLGNGEQSDHWHAAFAVDFCGQEQPPLQDGTEPDTLGIHTHGDGVVHIHPFASRASGKRATLGKFFDRVNLDVSPTEIRMPDGKIYREGETTCAGKPGKVLLAHWKDGPKAAGTKPTKVFTSDFAALSFSENNGAYTLAFAADEADIKAPSSAANIVELGQADGGGAAAPDAGQDPSGGAPAGPTGGGSPVTP